MRPENVFYEVLSLNDNSRAIRLHWTRLHVDDIHGTNLSYSIVSDDLRAFTKNCFYDLHNVYNKETRYKTGNTYPQAAFGWDVMLYSLWHTTNAD